MLPRGFHFAPVGHVDFWIPLQPTRSCDVNRKCHSIYGVARLADGMLPHAALANLTSIAADLQKQYPESNRDRDAALLLLEGCEATPEIEFLVRVVALHRLALLNIAGVEPAIHNERTAYRGIPVQADAIEVDGKGIARYRTFDIEWAGQRIPARAPVDSLGICASSIDGPRFDRITRVDMQSRFDRVREKVMKLRRLEVMSCSSGVRLRRFPRRLPFHVDFLFDDFAGVF